MDEIAILDPRAEAGVPITPYALSADVARPGLRVALVSNMFFDATHLLNAVGAALAARLPGVRVALHEFPNASLTAPLDAIERIARDHDVAVTALGHCGSCTSSATRDAVNLARAGLPACALISEKFWESAAFVARSVGMPEVPRVRLPHPVAGTGAARIAAIAEAAAPGLIEAWRGAHVLAA
jgi:hypothetical protein